MKATVDTPSRMRPAIVTLLVLGVITFLYSFWPNYWLDDNFTGDLCDLVGTTLLLAGANLAVRSISRRYYVTYLFMTASVFLVLARVADFTEEVSWFQENRLLGSGDLAHVLLLRGSEGLGYMTILITLLAMMYELARSRAAAQSGEKRFRELFQESQYLTRSVDLSADAVVAVNGEGCIQVWNKGAERLFGYSHDEVVHRPLSDVVVQGMTPPETELMSHMKRHGPLHETEVVAQRKNGERFAAGATFSPIHDENGATVGATVILRDIEDRKRVERQLLASRNLLAGALQAADVAILILDREGNMVELNPRFREIIGLGDDDTEMSLDAMAERGLDDAAGFLAMIREAVLLRGEHVEVRNLQVHRMDGETRVCNGAVAPVLDDDGAVMGVACVAVDVTEREILQAKLLESQKMESVGRLAGGVAHDFNNLLAGVLGYSTLLQEQLGPDSPHRKRLKTIEESALRASDLTRQLLTYARGGTRTIQSLWINDIVAETVTLLAHTIDPNIQLRTVLAPDLDMVSADRTQIAQVLMNLCLNSRDAISGSGEIRVSTINTTVDERLREHVQMDSVGRFVRLTVEDTGCGMSFDTRQKIFDPFFSTKRQGEGYGLGLSVVYGIVKSHHGGLSVESEVKKGTRIDVYLPSAGAVSRPEARPTEWKRILPGGTETILVIDDEQLIRALLRDIFETAGYTVLEAPTGEDGLVIFESRQSDIALVVLDMVMPGMGGVETLRKLLQLDENIRCIVSSGHSNEQFVNKAVDGRYVRFVSKPFQTSTLLSAARALFDS